MRIVAETGDKTRHRPLLLLADPSWEMVLRYLDAGEMFLLEQDGQVLAEAVVLRRDVGCELMNLAVREDCHRQGWGSALVRWLLEYYRGQAAWMEVGTSQGGVAFYRRLGFVPCGLRERFFTEHYPEPIWEDGQRCVDMILLRQELPPPDGGAKNPEERQNEYDLSLYGKRL